MTRPVSDPAFVASRLSRLKLEAMDWAAQARSQGDVPLHTNRNSIQHRPEVWSRD